MSPVLEAKRRLSRIIRAGASHTLPRPGIVAGIVLCVLIGLLAGGCLDEEGESECTPAPWDCEHSRPNSATLTILTGGGSVQEVRVYRGLAYETGTLVWSGTGGTTLTLPLGDYSATATYLVGARTVVAVDGDDLDYSASETCDGTCYETVDGEVDLRLVD